MPGIAGIISSKPADHCERLVKRMLASMEHERFYTTGTCFVRDMGIYAGSVAFGNSFSAGKVFFGEQRDIVLVFSGECFFDPEMGRELVRKGHKLGNSKFEWLIHLYEEDSGRFFEKLNGLFSGLLIDKRRKRAFLFNDRYGVERIYCHEADDAWYFASEAKALLRVVPRLRAFDREGVAQFLRHGCTLESKTLFREIQLLPGASVWTFENGRCRKEKFFSPQTWESQPELSPEAFESEFQETFARILPRYFDSESKVGISLTAGLDTRMLMACRPPSPHEPICYTFDGVETTTLDARLAARIAAACGLKHETVRIGPDFFSNFAEDADKTVYITDGYFGISGTHEIYLNRKARELAALRLGGAFGGEVLRGVSTFKPMTLSPGFIDLDFQSVIDASNARFDAGKSHPVTAAVFQEIPWNIFGSPAVCRSQLNFRTPYLDNEIVALTYRMPQPLRKSPLLAIRLINNAAPALTRIPTDMGMLGHKARFFCAYDRMFSKVTFKLDYLNNEGLPHWLSPAEPVFSRVTSVLGVVGLHKYLHYRSWFRRELADYVREAVSQCAREAAPFCDPRFLRTMAKQHVSGRKNYVLEINTLLTLGAVQRTLLRGLPPETELP